MGTLIELWEVWGMGEPSRCYGSDMQVLALDLSENYYQTPFCSL
jgi:hypothetical protein